jgi:hypothetical protein
MGYVGPGDATARPSDPRNCGQRGSSALGSAASAVLAFSADPQVEGDADSHVRVGEDHKHDQVGRE